MNAQSAVIQKPPAKRGMAAWVRDAGVCCSLANLVFLETWWRLLYSPNGEAFALKSYPHDALLAAAANVILLAALLLAIKRFLYRYPQHHPMRRASFWAYALFVLVPAANFLGIVYAFAAVFVDRVRLRPEHVAMAKLIFGITALGIAALLLRKVFRRKWHWATAILCATGLMFGPARFFAGACAIVIVAALARVSLTGGWQRAASAGSVVLLIVSPLCVFVVARAIVQGWTGQHVMSRPFRPHAGAQLGPSAHGVDRL